MRTVANCPIPIISAIGHQTDFVLTDFAADFRAETPSAAAELITSGYLEQISRLKLLEQSFLRIPLDYLARKWDRLALIEAELEKLNPQSRVDRYHQQLDDLEHRIQQSIRINVEKKSQQIESLEQRLKANSLPAALERGFSYLSDNEGNLIRSVNKLTVGKSVRAHLQDGSRMLNVQKEDSA